MWRTLLVKPELEVDSRLKQVFMCVTEVGGDGTNYPLTNDGLVYS